MSGIRTRISSPYPLRATKTITFDGSAGGGAVGTVATFTVTGRVLLTRLACFCTTTLVSAGGGSVSFGVTGSTATMMSVVAATTIITNDWWNSGASQPNVIEENLGAGSFDNAGLLVSGNMFITVATADVTAGVLVFDCWYERVTSNGFIS